MATETRQSGTTLDHDGDGVLLVVPTYNERANLQDLVARVFSAVPHCHLLIVDDDSPDGTRNFAASSSNSTRACTSSGAQTAGVSGALTSRVFVTAWNGSTK